MSLSSHFRVINITTEAAHDHLQVIHRLAMSSRGRRQDQDEFGEGGLRSQGVTKGALGTRLELLLEQQRGQQEQQQVLMALLEQQKEELAEHQKEMAELRTRRDNPDGGRSSSPAQAHPTEAGARRRH